MRFLTAVTLSLFTLPFLAQPSSGQTNCISQFDEFGRTKGVVCSGEARREHPSTSAKPAASGSGHPVVESKDVGMRAKYARTEEGEQCVRLVDFIGPGEASSRLTANAELMFLSAIFNGMPQCPGPDGLPAIASTPLIEAARFWQSMPLPDLVPRIQPGKALVGWKAFLETGGEPSVSTTGATPFGALSITATRSVTVDWDDGAGSVTGPHEGSGGPHPEGDITWIYGRSGPRDIAVTQTWTATWTIGGAGGTFSGRGTTSTLFGFPVEEVQAVRNR